MRVVGVAIEAGVLFMAAVEPAREKSLAASAVPGGIRRIEPNAGLSDSRRLVDLTHRVEDCLRSLGATHVSLAKTRRFSGWSYADALVRISCICALMAASEECEVEFVEVTTEAIARRVGAAAKALERTPASLFGFTIEPRYWRAGAAKACSAGAALLPLSESA